MFSAIYRYRTTKTGKYVKEQFLSYPKTENTIEKLLLVRFYCCFCLARSLKNDSLFLGHIALSQPIVKIMS